MAFEVLETSSVQALLNFREICEAEKIAGGNFNGGKMLPDSQEARERRKIILSNISAAY